MAWFALCLAILLEVTATSSLRPAGGGSVPAMFAVGVGYTAAIALLVWIVQRLDVGLVYAVWSGVGTALIASIGVLVFHDSLSVLRVLGISLIITGVVVVNLGGGH
jgi:small multidrug resistance pump